MKVKVKRGYVLFVGNTRRYEEGEIVDIDEETYKSQSWKVEVLEGTPKKKSMAKSDKVMDRAIKKAENK